MTLIPLFWYTKGFGLIGIGPASMILISKWKKMLKWKTGPIKEDGIWSKYWYHTVHKSSGFIPYKAKPELPKTLLKLYNNCRPYYKNLLKNALSTKRS